jgi:hypothetical protein
MQSDKESDARWARVVGQASNPQADLDSLPCTVQRVNQDWWTVERAWADSATNRRSPKALMALARGGWDMACCWTRCRTWKDGESEDATCNGTSFVDHDVSRDAGGGTMLAKQVTWRLKINKITPIACNCLRSSLQCRVLRCMPAPRSASQSPWKAKSRESSRRR